ncbi:hypothetical protein ACFWNK_30890 [Streptomyces sp. NPDC058417]|uniref:hypothetical protein n=1 Tax=unclassified Streptomyces TaxID=2593676 RepID=UPI00365E4C80
MTDRHATTADLPGWDIVDTVLGLIQQPGRRGWVWLRQPSYPRAPSAVGRDLSGRLYVASDAVFVGEPVWDTVVQGYHALLVGVADGIGLWAPTAGYAHIKPIDPDEPSTQPDMPRWLPIREVLKDMPDKMRG